MKKMKFRRFYFVHFLWLLLIVLIFIYLAYQFLSVTLPPKIVLTQPKISEFQINQEEYLIRGYVKRTYFLRINGDLVSFDRKGNFEKSIKLQKGLNFFKIEAQSRFGKKRELKLKILRLE